MRPYIDIGEFIEEGYLQEVNRQFFHPLGLALTVSADTDDDTGEQTSPWTLSGVQDHRDDLEGMIFAEGVMSKDKAETVASALAEREEPRRKALGYLIQPA
jgi:hypothetical protein